MSRQLLINGVPDCLRLDGWWLASSEAVTEAETGSSLPSNRTGKADPGNKSYPTPSVLVLILVLLADYLFWDWDVGLSMVIFTMALSVAMLLVKGKRVTHKQWMLALGFELLCNLPLLDYVQFLSVMFSLLGVAALAVWCAYDHISGWGQVIWTLIRGVTVGPLSLLGDLVSGTTNLKTQANLRTQVPGLALPLVVGFVFFYLLSFANPVLEDLLQRITDIQGLDPDLLIRFAFWLFAAALVWPCLHVTSGWMGRKHDKPVKSLPQIPWLAPLVTQTSIRNSLVLFNLLFLVQTATDIGFLSGGMSLPEGMTYASYAHRGAYPLVVTALLAGVFALATHRHIAHNKILRVLLFLWLGQNLLLVISAAFRLYIYVDVYSLTYLRIAAFIWMDLVFVGLLLVISHIQQGRSVRSLISANLSVLMAVLYLCSFVNFADLTASYNLRATSEPHRIDTRYICSLGEQALPAVQKWEQRTNNSLRRGFCHWKLQHDPIKNWREWGFRRWQLQRYLERT